VPVSTGTVDLTRRKLPRWPLRYLRESVAFGEERIPLDHEERFLQPFRIAPTVMEQVQGEVLGPKIALGDPHDGQSDSARL